MGMNLWQLVVIAIRFFVCGLALSVLIGYLAIELLPRHYVVVPNYRAAMVIAPSIVVGFSLSALFEWRRGKRSKPGKNS
jgi:hypothetical protein